MCWKGANIIVSIGRLVFFLTLIVRDWRNSKNRNQINRHRFTNTATSNIQIHILQAWATVAKSFISHLARLVDLPLVKDLVKSLKLCWRTTSFTYVFAGILKKHQKSQALFRMGSKKGPSYPIFPCNFYKRVIPRKFFIYFFNSFSTTVSRPYLVLIPKLLTLK